MGRFLNLKMVLTNCRRDRAKAVEILVKDLKAFAAFNEELFKEITQLLTLENFRYDNFFIVDCLGYVCNISHFLMVIINLQG